jgi:hypothetical protein
MADPAVATVSRSVHLVSRPVGVPSREDFAVVEAPIPALGSGELLVRTLVMSVDPYMRSRMNDAKSYAPPFELDQPMTGGAVGVVAAANGTRIPVGATVLHWKGWRDYAVLPEASAQVVDPEVAPVSAYLGVLGMPGLTAFGGLVQSGGFQPGDVVFVSAAAGAVGSLVGQLARLRGAARVIGSAGSADKVRYLTDELGFDTAFNYKDGSVAAQLKAAAPDGIDLYFDNVGGEQLEAAISRLNVHGRIALCGAISQYSATEPVPGPRNFVSVIGKRLRIQGLLAGDFAPLQEQFNREVGAYLAAGQITYRETFVDGGVDAAVEAFLGLFNGDNTGKMIVRF